MLELACLKDIDEIMINMDEVNKFYHSIGINQVLEYCPKMEEIIEKIHLKQAYIWKENKHIVGFFLFLPHQDHFSASDIQCKENKNDAWIQYLIVRPEYRKRRIPYKMLESIEKIAKEQGILSLKSSILSRDRVGTKILKECGFDFCGTYTENDKPKDVYEKIIK